MSEQIISKGANAIVFNDDKVLAIETTKGLAFPGGTFEPDIDNSLAQCCSRELLEETGLKIPFQALQPVLTVYTRTTPRNPNHSPDFMDTYYFTTTREHTILHKNAMWVGQQVLHTFLGNAADKWAYDTAQRMVRINLRSTSVQS